MKRAWISAGALVVAVNLSSAQTNAPITDAGSVSKETLAAPLVAAESPASGTAETPAIGATFQSAPMSLGTANTPEISAAPIDGIEGRRFNYTGAVPQAVKGGGFKGFLNLFNPFAKLSAAEKARSASSVDRPLPRGFVDETELEPVGLRVISVETK